MQHPHTDAEDLSTTAPDVYRDWIRDHVVLVVMAKDEGNRLDRLLASVRAQGVDMKLIYDGSQVWLPDNPEASVGFGVGRTCALASARRHFPEATWALLLDADMQLMGRLAELVPTLSANPADSALGIVDNIHLIQRDTVYTYDNVRLVRLAPERRCLGRTHELWESLGPTITDHEQRCWILDHCDGANRGEKYARDEYLLRQDLLEKPDDERTVFYLAQTLDGAGKLEEAIELYTRRVGMGGFEQEAWIARVRAGTCYLRAAGYTKGIGILLDAWARKPWRAEPLYEVAQAMVKTGQHAAALGMADLMSCCAAQEGDLFSEPNAYERGVADIRATSAYFVHEQRELGMQACEDLLSDPTMSRERTLSRQSWYLEPLTDGKDPAPKQINVLPVFLEGGRWVPTNPCVTGYGTNVRLVNYHQENGRHYESRDPDKKIRTRNLWITTSDLGDPSEPSIQEEWFYTLKGAETDHEIQGLEDCRFHRELIDYRAVFTATCCECPGEQGNPQVVIGTLDLETMRAQVTPIKFPGKQKYEKNWVILDCIGTFPNKVRVLYSINPTIVLTVLVATGEVVETEIKPGPFPGAGLLRNSTQPIDLGYGRSLMLAHDVGRREDLNVYMHRWVWLDKDWSVVRISEPFTIKHTGVEYACGLALLTEAAHVVDNRLVPERQRMQISFGVNDREAWTLDVRIP